jgi:hypothetical protein
MSIQIILRAGLLAGCAAAVAGCGSAGMDAQAARSTPKLTETACLRSAGARLATGPEDIAFFTLDRARGKAEKPGGAFLHHSKVVLEIWRSVPETSRRVPRWAMWTAQPLVSGTPLPPERVVAQRGPGYYVAYIRHPRAGQSRAVNRCLKAVQN